MTNLDVYNWCRSLEYFKKWTNEQIASYLLRKINEDRIVIYERSNQILALITIELDFNDKEIYVEHFVSFIPDSMWSLLHFGLYKYAIKVNDGWTIVGSRDKHKHRPLKFKLTTQTINRLLNYGRRRQSISTY